MSENEVLDMDADFDIGAYALSLEMKKLLAPLADEGSHIQTGTWDGGASMYIAYGGARFLVIVKRG
jgi:hypothetical protein